MQGIKLLRRTTENYLLFGIIAFLFTLVFQGYNDFIWSLALPLLDFFLVYLLYTLLQDVGERHFIVSSFVCALALRVIAVYIMSYILIAYNGMPFLSFKDDFTYQEAAVAIAQRWERSGIGFYDDLMFSADTYSGFPNFSAALMTLLNNTSYLIPRLGNAVLSASGSDTLSSYWQDEHVYSDRSPSMIREARAEALTLITAFSCFS